MINLPEEFLHRMQAELGGGYAAFLKSYERPAERAICVNTLKVSPENFVAISPVPLDGGVPWEKNAFYAPAEGLGKTIMHAAGLYYVQEPSAMCAAPELCAKPGERVLDLCSAPGGKGLQLARAMRGGGVLVLNEINRDRFKILESNVERSGVKNAVVTCASPERLAEIFEGYFDKILVDAPCSGEGMFKKEANAIPEWSMKNVALCAERQARILACADKMLAAGGRLVYSTCTFAREEDEWQAERFLQTYVGYKLLSQKKLYPHEVRGEGHFCAVFEKNCGVRNDLKVRSPSDGKHLAVYREWERETLNVRIENVRFDNGNLYYFSDGAPDNSGWSKKGVFGGRGMHLGAYSADGKRFEPSHALAMSLCNDEAKSVEADEKTALAYLKGLTFGCDGDSGWRLVTYLGFPLGWCKVVGGTAKNHLPKGLRI